MAILLLFTSSLPVNHHNREWTRYYNSNYLLIGRKVRNSGCDWFIQLSDNRCPITAFCYWTLSRCQIKYEASPAEGDHYSQSILGKIQIRFHLSPTFVEWTSPGEVKRKSFLAQKRFLGILKSDEATSNKLNCYLIYCKSEVWIIYRRRRTWLHKPGCCRCQHDNRRFYHFEGKKPSGEAFWLHMIHV